MSSPGPDRAPTGPEPGRPVDRGGDSGGGVRDPAPDGAVLVPTGAAVGAVEAAEAAVEGVAGALSLTPGSMTPSLGGELVLPQVGVEAARLEVGSDVASDSVRAGLLQSGPLALAGVVANAANVVVTVVLARLLTNHGYGQLNQLNGLFLIVSMPGSAVIVAVVRRVTAWSGEGTVEVVRRWAVRLHRQGTLAVVVLAVAVLAAGSWIAGLLGQHRAEGAVAIVVAAMVWVLLCLDRGLLQAHRRYRSLAANLLVEGGMRTVAMLALVAAGQGAMGAAVGVLVAEVVTAVHARLLADRSWAPPAAADPGAAAESASTNGGAASGFGAPAPGAASSPGPARLRGWRPKPGAAARLGESWRSALRRLPVPESGRAARRVEVLDLCFALVALAMVALLQNIDVIVVGRDLPGSSGSYAAVSVSSKVLVFGAVVLGSYLLPEAAIRWHAGGHALRQLAVTMLLLAIPAVLLLAIALGAPHLLLTVVFRHRYETAASAFAPLVAAMVCLSVTVILTMYLLAVGRRWITPLLVVGAVATTLAVISAHGHAAETAQRDLMVQGAMALATIAAFTRVHHRRFRGG